MVDGGAQLQAECVTTVHLDVELLDGSGDTAVAGWNEQRVREFYATLRRGVRTRTSAPSPGDWLTAFRGAPSDEVLCLTMNAGWSGAHQSAVLAASLVAEPPPRVTVFDTGTAAAAYGLVCRLAADLCAAGAGADEVLARARRAARTVRMYGTLPALGYVAAGGRVPALVAGLSDALHLHPVFAMEGARTRRATVRRSRAGALRSLERLAAESPGLPQRVLVFHADADADAAALLAALQHRLPVRLAETVLLDPVLGAHTGPGAVGFATAALEEGDPCC